MTKPNIRQRTALALFIATSLLATVATAAPDESQEGKRRGPPPEAFEACATLSEGTSCTFEGRRGDLDGTCVIPRHDEQALVCAPLGGRPDRKSE